MMKSPSNMAPMLRWNLAVPTHSAVVPAQAGTHNNRRFDVSPAVPYDDDTMYGSLPSRGRQRSLWQGQRITVQASQLQQLLRVLVIDLVLLLRRQPELVDQIDALLLEHEQGR